MGVIAILLPTVIDQIAAGEVIERPASVVKELVDNAVDAGATHITIETQLGGRGLIRVTDNGCGMSADDARLALSRHATSKIRAVDDLWGLATMGFRGEALPSIASVSRLTLVTRRAEDLAGTRVVATGGELAVSEIGAAPGTVIEVADLFYNVPARLKFLRGEGTEASHVTDVAAKLAMAHPGIAVVLKHNGRVALDVVPNRDGLHRAQALLGQRIGARLVATTGSDGGIRATAYLGAPELAQTTARGVQIFVGRRPIRDRGLLHAIAMGYGELVPRGRYPIAIVHLEVPAGSVDYNVHPQKLEVRFADANLVGTVVRRVVQQGIAGASWRTEVSGSVMMSALAQVAPPRLPFDGVATPMATRYATELAAGMQTQQARFGFDVTPVSTPRAWAQRVKDQVRAHRAAEAAPRFALGSVGGGTEVLRVDTVVADERELAEGSGPVASGFFGTLRYVGQVDLTYLVCEADGELVLIDQHAAHERVELARLQASGDRGIAIQKLLFPTTLEVAPDQLALVGRVAPALARVGFEAEAFGKTTLAVKAVPAGLRHGDPTTLLRKLLAEWAQLGAPSEAELIERMLSEIACHSVVRAGDRLSTSEAESLLRSLDGAAPTNPHGRPILLRLPLAEIARRFGR